MKIYFYIFLLIFILYSLCYFIYPTSIIILQTTLNEFNFNLLLQKQPLVIGDKIINIDDLINTWFSPNIINKNYHNNTHKWEINKYKYLFLYTEIDTEILLSKAGTKLINGFPNENKETILAIKLYKNQGLIIPFRWCYYIDNNNIIKYGIHDYITYVIQIIP